MKELLKYNPHEASVKYNPHHGMHDSIEGYYDKEDFIDYDECIRKQRVFQVRVYPNNSVGFYVVCASEYDEAISKMCEILKNER